MRRLFGTLAVAALVAGCGGRAEASEDAAGLADQLGCSNAKVTTKSEGAEPPRHERAECKGLTIVTFEDPANQETYVETVTELNKAFDENSAALVGDGWAVFGEPDALNDAQDALGGEVKR